MRYVRRVPRRQTAHKLSPGLTKLLERRKAKGKKIKSRLEYECVGVHLMR